MNKMTPELSIALLAAVMLAAFGLSVYGLYQEIKSRNKTK